jgi:hypothetical protein
MTRTKSTYLALVAVLLSPMAANADLIKSYDFNGDLTDTLGNGLDLIASGGALGGGRYTFGANQGLRLDSALPDTNDYTIEIKFQMDSVTPFWKKVLDFQNLTTDTGLYVAGDRLQFFNTTIGGPTSIAVNTDVIARVTRDGGTNQVQGFINDILQWSFDDGGNIAVPGGNVLNFFEDDFVTGQSETMTGSVDWIRISSAVSVPEPGTLALLGIGLAGIGFTRRRKKV